MGSGNEAASKLISNPSSSSVKLTVVIPVSTLSVSLVNRKGHSIKKFNIQQ